MTPPPQKPKLQELEKYRLGGKRHCLMCIPAGQKSPCGQQLAFLGPYILADRLRMGERMEGREKGGEKIADPVLGSNLRVNLPGWLACCRTCFQLEPQLSYNHPPSSSSPPRSFRGLSPCVKGFNFSNSATIINLGLQSP